MGGGDYSSSAVGGTQDLNPGDCWFKSPAWPIFDQGVIVFATGYMSQSSDHSSEECHIGMQLVIKNTVQITRKKNPRKALIVALANAIQLK